MNDDLAFFGRVLIFIVPTFISAIWMMQKQNKFFKLLVQSHDSEYEKYKKESNTLNPFKQIELINKIDATTKKKYSNKTLNQSAIEAKRAYNTTVVIMIISGIITFTLAMIYS